METIAPFIPSLITNIPWTAGAVILIIIILFVVGVKYLLKAQETTREFFSNQQSDFKDLFIRLQDDRAKTAEARDNVSKTITDILGRHTIKIEDSEAGLKKLLEIVDKQSQTIDRWVTTITKVSDTCNKITETLDEMLEKVEKNAKDLQKHIADPNAHQGVKP
jgi:methyl-accepting chemotaxis protein